MWKRRNILENGVWHFQYIYLLNLLVKLSANTTHLCISVGSWRHVALTTCISPLLCPLPKLFLIARPYSTAPFHFGLQPNLLGLSYTHIVLLYVFQKLSNFSWSSFLFFRKNFRPLTQFGWVKKVTNHFYR